MNPHFNQNLLQRNSPVNNNIIEEKTDKQDIENYKNSKLVKKCLKCELAMEKPTVLIDNDYKSKQVPNEDGKCFKNVKSFVICLSLLQLVQVMGSGYGKSALTSIERRYRLSSFEVGLLQSCFHIGNLSVILFVSYFGAKWHRPRAIAIGSVVMAFSSFLSAMPQFVGERYHLTGYQSFVAPPFQQENSAGAPSSYYNEVKDTFILEDSNSYNGELKVVVLDNITAFLQEQKQNFEQTNRTSDWNTEVANDYLLLHFQRWQQEQVTFSNRGVTLTPAIINSQPPQLVARKSSQNQSEVLSEERQPSLNEVMLCKRPKDVTGSSVIGERVLGSQSYEVKDDSSFYIFIAVGSILKGMGHTPLHPLGMSFIDDFATSRNSAIYIGVVSAVSLLGPAFGFIIGSQTTKLWVDIGWVDTSLLTIGPHDSSWVGAWWMGYLITGFLLLVAMIPLSLFPRVIKVEEEKKEKEQSSCFSCVTACFPDQDNDADASSMGSETSSNTSDVLEYQINNPAEIVDNLTSQNPGDQTIKEVEQDCLIEANLKQLAALPEVAHSETVPTLLYLNNDGQGAKTRLFIKNNVTCEVRRSVSAPHVAKKARRIPRSHSDGYSRSSFASDNARRRRSLGISQTVTNMALKDFAFTLKNLLNDRVFISITLGFVSLTSFLAASMTYAAKYMETEFDLTASHANLLNGSVNLPMAVAGNILGGLIMRRRNLNVKRTIAGVLLSVILTIFSITTLLFLGCEDKSVVGVNSKYSGRISDCSASCGCSDAHYFPVCDVTVNVTYKSPCHAGCTRKEILGGEQIFLNCGCVMDFSSKSDTNHNPLPTNVTSGILVAGKCAQPYCWYTFAAFVALMGTASMTAGLSVSPSTLTILRVVPATDKAIAIGVVFVFTRILAWIPAPVYVGSAIDAACLVWTSADRSNPNSDDQNHCELYDKARLRQYFFGAVCLQLILASLFYALALYLVTRRDKERGKLRHGTKDAVPPLRANSRRHLSNNRDDLQALNSKVV